MATNGADPHRILGVPPGASEAEIKRAYRALAKRHHPDAGQGSVARFLEIQTAYEALLRGSTGRVPGATGGRPGRPGRRPAQPSGPPAAEPGGGRAWSRPAGTGAEWARRPRAGGARQADPRSDGRPSGSTPGASGGRSGEASDGGQRGAGPAGSRGGSTSARTAGPGERPRPADASRRRRPPGRRATLGSTSYDEVDEVFEPDWRGASWYGPVSGTYWTINPKEYADPRKHGPEYQARARRRSRVVHAGDVGPPPPEGAGAHEAGPADAGAPGAERSDATGDRSASGPADAGAPGDRRAAADTPPAWRAGTWTGASAPEAAAGVFEHGSASGHGSVGGESAASGPGRSGPTPGERLSRSTAAPPPDAGPPWTDDRPRPERGAAPEAGSAAVAATGGPGTFARAALALLGWAVPGLALGAAAGMPGGLVATLPLQAVGVAVLALVPRAAWAAVGGGLALVFAAVPIIGAVAALGGAFVPGQPAPPAAIVLAAAAWTVGTTLVGSGRIAPYPWARA